MAEHDADWYRRRAEAQRACRCRGVRYKEKRGIEGHSVMCPMMEFLEGDDE